MIQQQSQTREKQIPKGWCKPLELNSSVKETNKPAPTKPVEIPLPKGNYRY